MEEMHRFELSEKESEILKQLASEDESFASFVIAHTTVAERGTTIGLTCAEAEQFREVLTTKLAEIGFDDQYSPNAEGDMLERLIDKFYLP